MNLTHKKKATFTVGALSLALLLTGSLAWQYLSQHKTNNFGTASLEHNVVLVETFEEVDNWSKGDVTVKEVAVRNGQNTDPANLIYEDAYIRLQFRQFMEIGTREYKYSEIRYMIDEAGNFVRFDTQDEAQAYLATLDTNGLESDVPEGGRIQNVKGYFDDKAYYYIATQAHDPNGQYGKFIVLDVIDGVMKPLVSGEVDYADSALNENDHNKQPEANGEHNYTVKKWDGVETAYDEYVEWILGADVMTKAEWIASGQEPVSKWIIDTDSPEGWVYWGQALSHSQAASVPNTMTSNFLEAIKLIKQPKDTANYQVNVFLDAVSSTDLVKWTDADESILDMLESIEGKNPEPTPTGKDLGDATVGDKITFGDREYTVVYIDDVKKQALILSNELTAADYSAMGVYPDGSGASSKYHYSATTYGGGYSESKLEHVDLAFFNTFVKESNDKDYVLPVTWIAEVGNAGWNSRSDGPTLVNKDTGIVKAFSLSVSDVIALSLESSNLKSTNPFWLRSPGMASTHAAIIGSVSGGIGVSIVDYTDISVRPALWIAID